MVALAEKDLRVVAVTAAMAEGTGLDFFARRFPRRFFDVGIAEQHAVTFAAGLASEGLRPFVAIYSTFLQRAYDQVLHDVCLPNLPVVLALDRGGIVGEDGPTHHGLFDLSYLRPLPNLTLMAPKDERELRDLLASALTYDTPAAIRYPRGEGLGLSLQGEPEIIPRGRWERLEPGEQAVILAVGNMVHPAVQAARRLQAEGLSVAVINARFIKPWTTPSCRSWPADTRCWSRWRKTSSRGDSAAPCWRPCGAGEKRGPGYGLWAFPIPSFPTASPGNCGGCTAWIRRASSRRSGRNGVPAPGTKRRLDHLLVEKGLATSLEKAKALIYAGVVWVDGTLSDKPGKAVPAAAPLEVKESEYPYVSRGGVKLAHALDHFHLAVEGKIALDVGASTGGFTHCLLLRGAALVHAVDVGYGQLAWMLRQDPRVRVLERQNARYLTPEADRRNGRSGRDRHLLYLLETSSFPPYWTSSTREGISLR